MCTYGVKDGNLIHINFFVRLVLPVFITRTPVDINDFRGVPATHMKYIG